MMILVAILLVAILAVVAAVVILLILMMMIVMMMILATIVVIPTVVQKVIRGRINLQKKGRRGGLKRSDLKRRRKRRVQNHSLLSILIPKMYCKR
jgi:5-bromo-4-chloroindolyl phosphate hydrolysis protein